MDEMPMETPPPSPDPNNPPNTGTARNFGNMLKPYYGKHSPWTRMHPHKKQMPEVKPMKIKKLGDY
jgi:hypothetical protein